MALKGTIAPAEVDPTEEDEVRAGRNAERDANQTMLDGMVGELKAEWEKHGKPGLDVLRTKAGFKAAGKRSIVATADDKADAKGMIRRSCTLHKVTPVFAKDKANGDGTVRIKWTVGPYITRQRATTTTETPATAETPAETPATTGSVPAGDAGTHDTEGDSPDPTGTGKSRRGGWGGR
jgi:hypothetical protein